MNAVQQKKSTQNTSQNTTLSSQVLNYKIQSQFDVSNIENFKFTVPKNKIELFNALSIIKDGLDKANKTGIDLQTAASLRNVVVNIRTIMDLVSVVSYKTDKSQNISLDKLDSHLPSIEQLDETWKLLSTSLEQGQSKGMYDSIDESAILYDNLMIIGNMLGSLVVYIKHRDQKIQMTKENNINNINNNTDANNDIDDGSEEKIKKITK